MDLLKKSFPHLRFLSKKDVGWIIRVILDLPIKIFCINHMQAGVNILPFKWIIILEKFPKNGLWGRVSSRQRPLSAEGTPASRSKFISEGYEGSFTRNTSPGNSETLPRNKKILPQKIIQNFLPFMELITCYLKLFYFLGNSPITRPGP